MGVVGMNSGKYERKKKKRGKKEKMVAKSKRRGNWSEIGRRTGIQQAGTIRLEKFVSGGFKTLVVVFLFFKS